MSRAAYVADVPHKSTKTVLLVSNALGAHTSSISCDAVSRLQHGWLKRCRSTRSQRVSGSGICCSAGRGYPCHAHLDMKTHDTKCKTPNYGDVAVSEDMSKARIYIRSIFVCNSRSAEILSAGPRYGIPLQYDSTNSTLNLGHELDLNCA